MIEEPLGEVEVERALAELSEIEYGGLFAEIRNVVLANLRNGRLERYRRTSDVPIGDYVRRIADTLKQDLSVVQRLTAHDEDEWLRQYRMLRMRAYMSLLRKGIPHQRAFDRSNDFAQDTCMALLSARFPGDVPHIAWAQRILRNQIEQQLGRRPDILDRPDVCSLDQDAQDEAAVPEAADFSASAFEEQIHNRDALERAILSLPTDGQRRVVRLRLAGCTEDEIAQKLGKSKQAVYNLWHRAVHLLRSELSLGGVVPMNRVDELSDVA